MAEVATEHLLRVIAFPPRYIGVQRLTSSGSLTVPEGALAVFLIADAAGARWRLTPGAGAAASAGITDPLVPTTGITLPLVDAEGMPIVRASVYLPGAPGAAEIQAVYLGG